MASITKRKNNDNHYEDEICDEFYEEYVSDRIKSKRVRINTEQIYHAPEICTNCGYGKIQNICRCVVNTNDIILDDNTVVKLCMICDNIVATCDCPISLWGVFQCGTCKISHSIFDQCNPYITCILCDKNQNSTDIGCRCIHGNIKYTFTDIDMKSIYITSDYVKSFDKSEYQPTCIQCGNHVSLCNCIKYNVTDIIDDNSGTNSLDMEENMCYDEEEYYTQLSNLKDEYTQMYYD